MKAYLPQVSSIDELASLQAAGTFARTVNMSGTKTDVSGVGFSFLWGGVTDLYHYPTAAEPLLVSSTSALDDISSTGATRIRIEGLDADYNEITEDLELTGLTPAVTTKSFLRVNICFVITVGALIVPDNVSVNLGEITLVQQTSTIQISLIEARFSVSRLALYTIPAGHNALIRSQVFSSDTGSNVEVFTTTRTPSGVIYSSNEVRVAGTTQSLPRTVSTPLMEKMDIALFASRISGSASDIAAQLGLLVYTVDPT